MYYFYRQHVHGPSSSPPSLAPYQFDSTHQLGILLERTTLLQFATQEGVPRMNAEGSGKITYMAA